MRDRRERAQALIRQAEADVAAGADRAALVSYHRAGKIARRLNTLEPFDHRHVAVLASISYNKALPYDRLGRGEPAITEGREAVRAYRFLVLSGSGPLTHDEATRISPMREPGSRV